ncbi:hypothetical protein SDC9_54525 [bioreactor metagenome]|uniref:Uncharacterized protein n=1 Tax=bioreactor metagenome TaxID=1076179 RepID=A0A644X1P9_9ZZZZ
MKNLRLAVLLPGILILALIMASGQSCSVIQHWSSKSGNFDKKLVRAERKALREQYDDDEYWGGDDEYNPWQENEDYDRDRW